MATASRRPLPTLKVKKLPPPRLSSPEKSKSTTTVATGKHVDPLEKRLLNIRLHILHNTSRRQQAPSEPTLVHETFLYLGGLKSLNNKVMSMLKIHYLFLFSIFVSIKGSTCSSQYYSHSLGCLHPTNQKSHCTEHQTSLS